MPIKNLAKILITNQKIQRVLLASLNQSSELKVKYELKNLH